MAADNNDTSVSVIIPVYNSQDTIADCLESVFNSSYSDFEVIVVDDNSSDGTAAIVESFPCKLIRLDRNYGPSKARNIGVESSSGCILVFFDGDVIIEKDTLSRIVDRFSSRPEISALFCSFKKFTVPSNFFTEYKNLRHHYTHQISDENATTFCGGFGAMKREVFLEFGGFNEKHRVLEDIEFGYRLHKAGHKILLAKDIQVTHCKKYSFFSLVKSDLLDRAIPWTRLMLSNKIFKKDLNVKTHNIISVFLSFIILLNLAIILLIPQSIYVIVPLILFLFYLNRNFLIFILKEKGMVFTAQSIMMNWFSYLYSGVGLLIALFSYIRTENVKS
jgi:glycosyltransferase involved in cell wall biosynthesis